MNRPHWLGLIAIGTLCAVALLGCQQRTVVPTVALEPTQPVVVVVVTATNQPTLAPTNTAEPSITPIPALTEQVTQTVTATLQAAVTQAPTRAATRPPATAAAVAVKPTAAAEATTAAGAPAPTTEPVPAASFQSPQALSPEGVSFKNGATIKFQFGAVGPLGADQCYRVDMTLLNPAGVWGVSDYWVGLCGDQSAVGTPVTLQVGKFRDMPNYSTLLANADSQQPSAPQYTMQWTVTVVRVTDRSDQVHPKTEPISPPSRTVEDSFFRS